jgi:hypothetical protein
MRPSFLLPLCLVLFGCQGPASSSQELSDTPAPAPEAEAAEAAVVDEDGMVMRTYSVEPDRVREVRSVLGRLLQGAKEQPDRGRVEELGGGRIVVVAPPGIQSGVQQMLDEMAQAPVGSHTRSVEVSYWFVMGQPAAEGDNAADFPAIGAALEEVAKHSGPIRFEMLEQASLRSLLNERADTAGNRFSVEHVVSKVDRKYVADLRLRPSIVPLSQSWHGRLETRVVVDPGTLLVVGQSGYSVPKARSAPSVEKDDDRTLYYIIRIDSHDDE